MNFGSSLTALEMADRLLQPTLRLESEAEVAVGPPCRLGFEADGFLKVVDRQINPMLHLHGQAEVNELAEGTMADDWLSRLVRVKTVRASKRGTMTPRRSS
jgi:hypothetical protein